MPSAAKSEAATVPSAAVGETTAGVAVEAAGAAILAWSMGPKPNTERGGEEIPGQAARTVEPQAAAITEPQAAGPGGEGVGHAIVATGSGSAWWVCRTLSPRGPRGQQWRDLAWSATVACPNGRCGPRPERKRGVADAEPQYGGEQTQRPRDSGAARKVQRGSPREGLSILAGTFRIYSAVGVEGRRDRGVSGRQGGFRFLCK